MAGLREFARHKEEFQQENAELIAIGPDDPVHGKKVWEGPAAKSIQILLDPDYKVISAFGLKGEEETRRTVVVIDENGNEIYRRPLGGDESHVPDEILAVLNKK